MIIEGLLLAFFGVLDFILGFFPSADSGVAGFVGSQITFVRDQLTAVSGFIDVNSFLYVLGLILTIELVVFLFRLAKWVIQIVSAGFIKTT